MMEPSILTKPVSVFHEPGSTYSSHGQPISSTWRILCALIAVVPFLSIYLRHYLSPGIPTGFIQYDQPYYVANGREVFERGNGFAYPNPYDPDPQAPVIYFHWLPWLLGFGVKKLGFDPGIQYVAVGAFASLVCSWLTFRLVEAVLPERRYVSLLFFLVMWGGGILCLARAYANLEEGLAIYSNLLAYDPALGWWFQSWGRNLVYPTEAIYHAIVAGIWLAVVRRHWLSALLGVALLATTHPFSGFQLLLILFTWFTLLLCFRRSLAVLASWLAVTVMFAVFYWYYMVYLESFEQHQHLRRFWSLEWTISVPSLILAYGPMALLAAIRVWVDRRNLDYTTSFFATCFAVSFILVKHDWLTQPRQPLHFTRGYIWMPLCLIALPYLQRLLVRLRARTNVVTFGLLLLLPGAVAVSDDVLFISDQWRKKPEEVFQNQLILSAPERDMFAWMDRQGLDGVLLCPDLMLSYLSATYTSVRPYYGHEFNTPLSRKRDYQAWLSDGEGGPWMEMIDYILVSKEHPTIMVEPKSWEVLYENEGLILYQRKRGEKP